MHREDLIRKLRNKKQLMIDLETMDKTHDASIVQIGAAWFHALPPEHWTEWETPPVEETFRVNVDLQSCLDIGLTMSAGTIVWWLQQSPEAHRSVFRQTGDDVTRINEALMHFNSWVRRIDRNPSVWSHGATFDAVILQNAYNKAKIKPPYHYSKVRDTRTLLAMVDDSDIWGDSERRYPGPKHDGLVDSVRQGYVIQRAHCRLLGLPEVV